MVTLKNINIRTGYLAEDDELEQLGEEDDDEVEDEADELSENEGTSQFWRIKIEYSQIRRLT